MQITINIDDSEIERIAIEKITDAIAENYHKRSYGEESRGRREAVQKSVKEIIYSDKENLINRCVEQASREKKKKGLPKLIEKL